MSVSSSRQLVQQPFLLFSIVAISLTLFCALYWDGLANMIGKWGSEEYSHGYMIPLVSLYLIIIQAERLNKTNINGSWYGPLIVLTGCFIFFLGELSTLFTIIQYASLVTLTGLFVALIGVKGTRLISGGLIYLIFMIPLPNFIFNNLSSQLQLISSSIGVSAIRLMDISVFLEGNVIDLGTYKLQVVEACSGLNYLFPLMSFGFLVAYLYRAPRWQKALIFLSTIPITILMNSFRIAVIGVTVNNWGIAAAEGFLHAFEGWIVFMACLAILTLEIWCLHLISGRSGSLMERLQLNSPDLKCLSEVFGSLNPFNVKLLCCAIILGISVVTLNLLDSREIVTQERLEFNHLPLFNKGWIGREGHLDVEITDTLKLTDYFIADYRNTQLPNPVNLYIAYYNSQSKGASVHSPKSCIPGGGWQITDFSQVTLRDIQSVSGLPLRVNRSIIEKDGYRNLVYYWFQQRGKVITNEYMAKWLIFWDGLTMNRTDGALVRLVVELPPGQTPAEGDEQLIKFLNDFYYLLGDYIPN